MKIKITLLVLMILGIVNVSKSCPIYRIGKIYIIDENNRPLSEARIIKKYGPSDSFVLSKSKWFEYEEDQSDTDAYNIYSGGLHRYRNGIKKEISFRITAPGYTEVNLKEISFIYSDEVLPVLYIKLYRKKIVRQGDLISVVSRYSIEEITEVKDTTYININSYTPILENNGLASALNTISLYPNPAKDFVILTVQSGLNSNYKVSVSDMSGKVLKEILVNTQETKIDLSWESPGFYFVNLYDSEGQLIYGNKFIKI